MSRDETWITEHFQELVEHYGGKYLGSQIGKLLQLVMEPTRSPRRPETLLTHASILSKCRQSRRWLGCYSVSVCLLSPPCCAAHSSWHQRAIALGTRVGLCGFRSRV